MPGVVYSREPPRSEYAECILHPRKFGGGALVIRVKGPPILGGPPGCRVGHLRGIAADN